MLSSGNSGLSIAVAGKGGTGKTTISGIIISYLVKAASGRILAVDADPSANLGLILGVSVAETLGDVREETINSLLDFPAGMTKSQFLEFRINQAVQEEDRYDLLTMGRPEGAGCYCFVNRLLRTALDTLSRNYRYVVMDCEAGLEHVSRRTSREIDHLLVVTDLSRKGLDVAERVALLADELNNRIGKKHLLVNRCQAYREEKLAARIKEIMAGGHFHSWTTIPEDDELLALDLYGKTAFELSDKALIHQAVTTFLSREIVG